MANEKNVNVNASGANDPTAGEAISNVDKDSARFREFIHVIFYICKLAGFKIDGRVTFVDKRTGKVWK